MSIEFNLQISIQFNLYYVDSFNTIFIKMKLNFHKNQLIFSSLHCHPYTSAEQHEIFQLGILFWRFTNNRRQLRVGSLTCFFDFQEPPVKGQEPPN